MLQKIRDNSQGMIAKVIIGFIIALMALFGVESIVGGFVNNSTVAEVNGEEITEPELATSVQNLMMSVGADLANLDEGLLREVALNQIIEDRLLNQSARNASMTISSDAIDRQIINNPQFQIGGVFDSNLALRTMATQGFSVQAYRDALSKQMVVGQLVNAYASSSFMTQNELERIAALTSQTRDFRFLSVTLGNRTEGEVIPADQIETYYQNNQSRFMVEEEVAVDYALLDKSAIFGEVEVSDADVQAQYEIERNASSAATQRRASHILLELSNARTQEQALAQAADLKTRLDQGEDFAAIALEASSDTISAQSGGDIGYSDGSAFPPELEEVLATLEVGQISAPVVSEFGVHIVKLTEYDLNEFAPIEEVSDRIRRDLSSAEVDQLYFSRLETLANLAFETTDLREISEDLGLEIVESEAFSRLGGTTEITSNSNVVAAAFTEEVLVGGNNSEVVEIGDSRALVLNLREHNEAHLRPLEEVRGEIAAILRTELEKERARAVGEELLASLRNGQPVEEMIAESELQWISQNGVSRDQSGLNTEVLQRAFTMLPPEGDIPTLDGFALSNGTYVILELQSVNLGTLDQLATEERTTLISSSVEADGRAAFDAFLSNSRNNADITESLVEEEPLL
ncbi:MAG: SurA N-terminal domain-containing protein [Gammaproteobacteria bacterium]|nr:SurA N-terminal domain-containing protein [Gammaproteobacteria bacterium]